MKQAKIIKFNIIIVIKKLKIKIKLTEKPQQMTRIKFMIKKHVSSTRFKPKIKEHDSIAISKTIIRQNIMELHRHTIETI
jgi:hypothetical protein